ncbi:hypothetical protein BC831DRAFT_513224 [Entophlyctis helioformis]|nr:hypothetical protein BC831DRAFT_513224 [Entophlyctis helioformis]
MADARSRPSSKACVSGKVKASSASGRVFVGHPGATLGDITKDASKNALMNICSASGSIGIQLA